ncbi:ATP synthase F1 subunit gamma [Desulfobulbus oligotrophicus]|jgi:F-type H+-transporting ATPase subunit gamma|uniref:ATP synthase gamma chain n=1 Tax=Desulfobulbus oligotrophicus TaxID=1909699 RepID=A0A7T6AQE3_9BACT|nr:ATP synthase F1 subunit gamma [Desulfobulbus oligotrophicus]MDY0389561.1 ATP synthase F1 subunit gamma [Desulfobulbus oligotrophicus]QQG65390.1 ATP synthase F1 subunit gamma [Desulfobulbus oligotrophicus]
MPGLKDVKDKINGVKKTAQITKAMNMVASAKLRGAQEKMERFRPYASKFAKAMSDLSSGMESTDLPLMEKRDVRKVEIVVVTSDRGLCGSFNANIIKAAEKLRKQYEGEGKTVSFVTVGKKASQVFKRSGKLRAQYNDIMSTFQMFNAREISQNLIENFINGESDQVDIVYGRFYSVAIQRPERRELLPIQPIVDAGHDGEQEKKELKGSYTYEPDPDEIMEVLQPLFLNVQLYHAMLEVGASEHAARMTAMDNATNACKDMIKQLTMLYNKARQAAVTSELMDIVGGAEALKG